MLLAHIIYIFAPHFTAPLPEETIRRGAGNCGNFQAKRRMGNKANRKANIRVHLGMQGLTSGISITLVLVLVGMIVLSLLTAHNLSRYVRENISFTVYADPDAEEADILALQADLEKQPYVKGTTYISAAQALEEQTRELGADPEEFLGYNPYTPMIEVKLKASYANTDSIRQIEQQIGQSIQIAEVSYQPDLIDSVNRNIRFIALVLAALAALFTLISFVLISNTMRLAVYSKRFLIHTMQLVGAGWGFIRYPFVMSCVGMGLLAGVVACLLLGGGVFWITRYEPGISAILTPQTALASAAAVLLSGVAITGLSALLSINHYLRMRDDRLFHT